MEQKYQYNQKELNSDFGLLWSDYGARWLDLQRGVWGQIDPLAEKYAAWSGYNYVAGNPIRNIDPDGRVVLGSDGKAVSYDTEKKEWSANATDDVKTLGNAMMATPMGTEAFIGLINSKTEITINIDEKTKPSGTGGAYAATKPELDKKGKVAYNDDGSYKKASITIYLRGFDDKKGRYSTATKEEFLNATGTHEKKHIDPEQIKKDEPCPNCWSTETKPINDEYDARNQYRSIYGGGTEWKTLYETPNRKRKDSTGSPRPGYYGNKKQGGDQ